MLGAGLTRTIDFGSYLTSLCDSFLDLENPDHQNVALSCDCQPLMLDLDTSTALGLVITELLSNSFQHAFPQNRGAISVTLLAGEPGEEATIKFADDGMGFVETGHSKRRGLGLVKRLMQQVKGSAEVHSDHGTAWTLTFPVPTLDDGSAVAIVEKPAA